jgi:hypothetical protein
VLGGEAGKVETHPSPTYREDAGDAEKPTAPPFLLLSP